MSPAEFVLVTRRIALVGQLRQRSARRVPTGEDACVWAWTGCGPCRASTHLTNFLVLLMWSHCSFVRLGGPAFANISPETGCASESSRARPNRPRGCGGGAVRGLGSGVSTPQCCRPETLAGGGQLQESAAGRLLAAASGRTDAASGRADESARLEARRRPPTSRDRTAVAMAPRASRSATTKRA